MTLSPSGRLGPYEIVSMLGAGGMGEVYKARDTRLDRTVAIKVLPAEMSADANRRQRLEREARAISRLNHPHICTLHDVGHQDGIDYLVMEYLEGESLAQRLERGPLPPAEVLRYGREIAGALEKAHRAGIVHRDLKPGNVMLTKSGVKLLDFGLAKPRTEEPEPSALSAEETRHKPLTGEGSLVGTVPYMAPEQLEGREADARSDIWALGTVIYEMATAHRAFTGESQASLIAAIMDKEPPPIATTQPLAPAELERVVRACLAKDPDLRWQSAQDVATGLGWVAEGRMDAPAAASRRSVMRERIWMGVALVAALAAAGALWRTRKPAGPGPLRLSLVRPPNASYIFFKGATLSPDGRRIVFTAYTEDGRSQLWVRALDEPSAQPLPGTDGGRHAFWSPDSRSIAFFADGKLKRMDASGGPARVLCAAPDPQGGDWSAEDVIVFGPSMVDVLYRVPAGGGTPVAVTSMRPAEEGHRWPSFLPDGRHFVFLGDAPRSEDHWLRLGSLDGGEVQDLLPVISNAIVSPTGHLLFARGGHLMAQRFDLRRRRLLAEPVSVAEHIFPAWGNHRYEMSVSATGLLSYRAAAATSQLTWYDRTGRRLSAIGEPGIIEDFAISPDGRRVVLSRSNADRRREDLWLLDLEGGVTTRLTTDRVGNAGGRWSPDGRNIAFTSFRSGLGDLYQVAPDSPGAATMLLHLPDTAFPSDWTPDGRTLLFNLYTKTKKGDVWALPVPGEPKAVLDSEFDELDARVSPDGRWIAYVSDESGQDEVYVQAFPGPGQKKRVSVSGGWGPRWRRDGRELLFADPTGERFLSAPVEPGPPLQIGAPRELFRVPRAGGHEVSPDAQRFLLNVGTEDITNAPMTVLVDWTAALRSATR